MGDVKEVFDISFNNETRNRMNAREYMFNKLDYLRSVITQRVKKHLEVSQDSLDKYLKESLSFKERV